MTPNIRLHLAPLQRPIDRRVAAARMRRLPGYSAVSSPFLDRTDLCPRGRRPGTGSNR